MSLVEFTRFINDAAALEKTLRLLQGLAQLSASIFAYLGGLEHLIELSGAIKKHFALGRRYFRYFKWLDCAMAASNAIRGDEVGGTEGVLDLLNVAKWSYLGMYLLTEAFTILDAMGLRKSSWAPTFLVEGMRFWFYSISCSIILSICELRANTKDISKLEDEISMVEASIADDNKAPLEKEHESEQQSKEKPDSDAKKRELLQKKKEDRRGAGLYQTRAVRQLIVSCCDLLTPGPIVGWIPAPPSVVAITSIISSTLGAQDIWKKVNKR